MRRPTRALAAAAVAGLVACGGEDPTLPRVSLVRVEPADTLVAPLDTVRLGVTALGLDGTPVDVPIAFQVDPGSAGRIDSLGLFVALAEGDATVTAVEPGGVIGQARISVAPVSGLTPPSAAFGGLVTARGAGFGPSSAVRFGSVTGRVRHVTPDGRSLEAWVPWDAENGAPLIRLENGREVPAPSPFFLTGSADDALEPNDLDHGTPVPVPFENPYLASRLVDMDHYTFTLNAPTPLTVRVSDRNELNTWPLRLVLQLTQASGFQEFFGVTPVFGFERNERQDGVIARRTLGPGSFAIRVFVAPGPNVVDRRYELRIDTIAEYQLPPDPAEPDDAPLEAPVRDSSFDGRFTLENPWATDYYALDVTERSRVSVSAFFGAGLGVFLVSGEESVTWQLSNGVRSETFRGAIGPFGAHSFTCTVEPGRYYVGVLDNSGTAGTYDLGIEIEPTDSSILNCRTITPRTDATALRVAGVAR